MEVTFWYLYNTVLVVFLLLLGYNRMLLAIVVFECMYLGFVILLL